MSVVSERSSSSRRLSQRSRQNGRRAGAAIADFEQPFLIPPFSAAASEGVKPAPREDDWAENTTVLTGTSEHSYCGGGVPLERRTPISLRRRFRRAFWLGCLTVVGMQALCSAPTMVILPVLLERFAQWNTEIECSAACQAQLLSLSLKSILLCVGIWAVFWRRAPADLPRLFVARAALLLLLIFVLFAFWLFYSVRILMPREVEYIEVVNFSLSLLDALLFLHYLTVVILELRSLRPEFAITIVRDPDGESKTLCIGMVSIQQAAVQVLRQYHATFSHYNPHLEKARSSRLKSGLSHSSGFKMYDLEGFGDASISEANSRALLEAAARRHMAGGHNEYMHEEISWEQRVRKRRCRLLASTEEAFSHVQDVASGEKGFGEAMEARNAAEAVFPLISRPLTKFLRLTRQQLPHNTAEPVVKHLARCLAMRLSARTFLQRFLTTQHPPQDLGGEMKWSIVCDAPASQTIRRGHTFVLRSQDTATPVQLWCTINELPFINLTEQCQRPAKFALRISGETNI